MASAFAQPNHILFQRIDESCGIRAFPISLETLERTATPLRVSDVGASPSAAADGTIAYSLTSWDVLGRWQLTWVERSGKILNSIGPPLPGLMDYCLSPGGRRVAAVAGESLTEREVWLFDLADGSANPVTKSAEPALWPGWKNGGRNVVFTRIGAAGIG